MTTAVHSKPNGNCRLCASDKLRLVLDFGPQPMAHGLLDDPGKADKVVHPLAVHQCQQCGFAQILDYIEPDICYKDYNFCFSHWRPQPQIPRQCAWLKGCVPEGKVLEIASNDGMFLSAAREAGFNRLLGVEPNPYASGHARDLGFEVVNDMFNKSTAHSIRQSYGRFDAAVIRAALEHIPDLHDFFESINLVLAPDGWLMVEVPDFDMIIHSGDCSTIWEEHVNYFSEKTLAALMGQYGFKIEKIERYDFSGGAMCVMARRGPRGLAEPEHEAVEHQLEKTADFARRVEKYAARLNLEVRKARRRGRRAAFYGAGCRGALILNGLGLGRAVDALIDDQPEKQGLYMPGCRLPVRSLEKTMADNNGAGWFFLLAVSHESEAAVKDKIKAAAAEAAIISLCAPNDLEAELDKLGVSG